MRDTVRRLLSYANKIYSTNLTISVCNLYTCTTKDPGTEGRITQNAKFT